MGSADKCRLPFEDITLPAPSVMTSAGMPATASAAGSASRASLAAQGTARAPAADTDWTVRL